MLNLPRNWNDITFYQYQELVDIELNIEDNKMMEQLAVLLDTSPDDEIIADLDIDEVIDIFSKLKWLQKPIQKKIEKLFDDKKLKDFSDIRLGEFIDIEYYLQKDAIDGKLMLASILYRRFKVDEWNNIIYEPYIYDPIERSELYKSMSICSIEGLMDGYLSFRDNFLKNYQQLFESEESFEEDFNDLQGREVAEMKKALAENKKKKKWGYENLIWNLSSGDVTKFEEIFDMKLILVFNVLSMRKSLGVE
jgi:hypothetical protein